MHNRTALALAILAVFAIPQASLAETTAETASRWGLLGTWRLDCGKAPNGADGDLRYVVRGGKLFHDRDFGDRKDTSQVMSATMKTDGSLELIVNFGSLSQARQYAVIKGNGGRVRAMFNRNVDTNEYTIKDGKFTQNGNDTPWQTRCR